MVWWFFCGISHLSSSLLLTWPKMSEIILMGQKIQIKKFEKGNLAFIAVLLLMI